jgi:hypothetical protein
MKITTTARMATPAISPVRMLLIRVGRRLLRGAGGAEPLAAGGRQGSGCVVWCGRLGHELLLPRAGMVLP